jgi:hypothetical protein
MELQALLIKVIEVIQLLSTETLKFQQLKVSLEEAVLTLMALEII